VRQALVLVLLAALVIPGCLDLSAARVPDRLLEGAGGNGWEKDARGSQAEPSGGMTSKAQTLAYVHPAGSGAGYQGTLSVTTYRNLLSPSESSVRDALQAKLKGDVESKGVALQGAARQGTRTVANHAQSYWFAYEGKVSTGGTFSTDARVKIFGEVFRCPTAKTVVATVGLAQVTSVRSVGGVPVSTDEDATTWNAIVGDPGGTIDGARLSDGLAYNVQC